MIKVPNTLIDYSASLAEPISCTVNAAENSNIKEGDAVVVVGTEPMDILNTCMAQEFGASKVIMSEINENRLIQATGFGINRFNNSAKTGIKNSS
ncbi:MAG: hypothetical protein K8R40_00030 [Anaerolineaceae bacterium]|nr:hypothetical protein [Anaerolineaceae bacterium]